MTKDGSSSLAFDTDIPDMKQESIKPVELRSSLSALEDNLITHSKASGDGQYLEYSRAEGKATQITGHFTSPDILFLHQDPELAASVTQLSQTLSREYANLGKEEADSIREFGAVYAISYTHRADGNVSLRLADPISHLGLVLNLDPQDQINISLENNDYTGPIDQLKKATLNEVSQEELNIVFLKAIRLTQDQLLKDPIVSLHNQL